MAAGQFIKPDPIDAAKHLLSEIIERPVTADPLNGLARAIDAYIYAVSDIAIWEDNFIESIDFDFPHPPDIELRADISKLHPELGYYWQALHSSFDKAKTGKIAVGDAIDDLLDVSKELKEVVWLEENHGRQEALAGLHFRHRSHIWMHIWLLRAHIEDLLRE